MKNYFLNITENDTYLLLYMIMMTMRTNRKMKIYYIYKIYLILHKTRQEGYYPIVLNLRLTCYHRSI